MCVPRPLHAFLTHLCTLGRAFARGCRYVIVNVFVGFTLFMWVGQPFLYWFNVYNARNFEFFGSELFNPDGTPYDVSLVSPQSPPPDGLRQSTASLAGCRRRETVLWRADPRRHLAAWDGCFPGTGMGAPLG